MRYPPFSIPGGWANIAPAPPYIKNPDNATKLAPFRISGASQKMLETPDPQRRNMCDITRAGGI